MALGPGKYDNICTRVHEDTQAQGVLLIVINGALGSGFSAQLTPEDTGRVPQLLRQVADQIEAERMHKDKR